MKKLSKKHRRNIVILASCLFVLLIGFQNCGKKGSETFPSGSGSSSTTTTTTSSQNTTLEVTEIEDSITTPRQSWTWNCTQSFRPCKFRYHFSPDDNTSSLEALESKDYILNDTTANKNDVEGNYFLYIQAEKNGSKSAVKKVPIVIGPESNEGGGNPALIDQIDIGGSHDDNDIIINSHACSLLKDGHVKCWGSNNYGQLGYEDKKNRGDGQAGSVNISGLPNVNVHPVTGTDDDHLRKFIATGANHTCVLLRNECIKCWGENDQGQLGYNDKANNFGDSPGEMGEPLKPVGGLNFKVKSVDIGGDDAVLATGHNHTCAITKDDSDGTKAKAVKCWGANDKGQLGQGNTDNLTFNEAPQSNDIADIDIHDDPNEQDQAKTEGFLPRHIATGAKHTCAVLNNDCVKCWGGNQHGQLGLGDTDHRGDNSDDSSTADVDEGEMGTNLPPIGDADLSFKVKTVVTGDWHTCAIMLNGEVQCWGWNDKGQLGVDVPHIGNTKNAQGEVDFIPVDLGNKTAKSITAGAKHTCVTLEDDTTKCWGLNKSGQLGQGSTDDINDASGTAVPIENSGTIAGKTVAGGENTCFIGDDGKVKCWGNNEKGQLAQDHACSLGNGLGYSASSNDKCNPSSTASDVMGKTVDTIEYLSFE